MAGIEQLEAAAARLEDRVRTGPVDREPGVMYASADAWWDRFWRDAKETHDYIWSDKRTGEDTHRFERHAAESPTPERRSAAQAAHGMTSDQLRRYADGKGWRIKPGNQVFRETTVGDLMLRDVVRKELAARGQAIQM